MKMTEIQGSIPEVTRTVLGTTNRQGQGQHHKEDDDDEGRVLCGSPADHQGHMLAEWIDRDIRPEAFITILLPFIAGVRPHEQRRVRDHQFYLNLWTRKAENTLWGASAVRLTDYHDRCLFFFMPETICQQWRGENGTRGLQHYHGVCRFPDRPMREEHAGAHLSPEQRCGRLQTALIDASKTTPEPYATHPRDRLRGANIDVRPYRSEHAPYLFKQLHRRFSHHWTERADGLQTDSGLLIFPHVTRARQPARVFTP